MEVSVSMSPRGLTFLLWLYKQDRTAYLHPKEECEAINFPFGLTYYSVIIVRLIGYMFSSSSSFFLPFLLCLFLPVYFSITLSSHFLLPFLVKQWMITSIFYPHNSEFLWILKIVFIVTEGEIKNWSTNF